MRPSLDPVKGQERLGKARKDNNRQTNPSSFRSLKLFKSLLLKQKQMNKNVIVSVSQCKYGYMVVGDRNRTCRAEARWSGRQPECREINCGPPGP